MTNKRGHRIAKEVKEQILKRVKEEGVSISEAAKEHGVAERTIYDWLGRGTAATPSWAEFNRLEKQNKELFEVVGELTVKLSQAQKKN